MTKPTIAQESTTEIERYQITDMEGVRWYLKKLLEKDTLAAAIKAEATGEPLPGFEFKPSEERFTIRQSKAKNISKNLS